MATTYTYSVSADFPNGEICVSNLDAEIRASAITVALDYILLDGDTVDIVFKAPLGAQQNILDGGTTGPAGGLIAATNTDCSALASQQTTNVSFTGGSTDAFSRLRVGLPKLRLSTIFDTDKRPLFWSEQLTAGGTSTHLPNERSINMTVSASGDSVVRQTKEYFTYRAGQSQLIFATFVMGTADAAVRQRVGYFDAENGLFLQRDGSTAAFVRRTFTSGAAVDNVYAQASWNIDRLDGSGASGITLDLTKCQILVIDFQWLGVGRVRFGFDIEGDIVYAHQLMNANNLSLVYMTTPKLPVRYEITATGVPGGARTLKQICATVNSEGGDDEPQVLNEARSSTVISVTSSWETVLGVRLKSSNLRATLRVLRAVAAPVTNSTFEVMVVLNPSLVGVPVWSSAGQNSAAEFSRSNLAVTLSGSDPVVEHTYPLGGYMDGAQGNQSAVTTSASIEQTVPIAADLAGTRDQLWLLARNLAGGTEDVRGLLGWVESR